MADGKWQMNSDSDSGSDSSPYRVKADVGRFEVVTDSGRSIVLCRDQQDAEQYAVLLVEAYERGFKAGFRSARRAS